MKLVTVVGCLLCFIGAIAQKEKGYAYVNQYKAIAIAEMQRTGVPAAITLAQGILESQYGESELCKKSNNHFGIKCKTEWAGDKVFHDDDTKQECFRVYPDAAASFKDHSDFLKTRPYYANLFTLSTTDVEGWCFGLKKAGYATEKDYAQRLLQIINDYNLSQYNLAVVPDNIASNTATEPITKSSVAPAIPIFNSSENPYPEGIFTINHVKVVYAKAGTSLLLLANQYDLPLSKLLEFNDLEDVPVLPSDNLIFIEKKMKKGAVDYHVVSTNETVYTISQKEGVRLESLVAFNGISKYAQPLIGEKIYLRTPAPSTPKQIKDNATLGSN
jgi:LysM repeat protein